MSFEEGPCPDIGNILPSLQEKYYPCNLRELRAMGKTIESISAEALSAFRANVAIVMTQQNIESHSEMWRVMKKKMAKGMKVPARKSINNALSARHDAQISTLAAIADGLNVPIWILLIPDLNESDLASPHRERLAALVQNYLHCDNEGRNHTESMAAAFASKSDKTR